MFIVTEVHWLWDDTLFVSLSKHLVHQVSHIYKQKQSRLVPLLVVSAACLSIGIQAFEDDAKSFNSQWGFAFNNGVIIIAKSTESVLFRLPSLLLISSGLWQTINNFEFPNWLIEYWPFYVSKRLHFRCVEMHLKYTLYYLNLPYIAQFVLNYYKFYHSQSEKKLNVHINIHSF